MTPTQKMVGEWQSMETAPKDMTQIIVARHMDNFGWILGTAYWNEVAGIGGWMSLGIAGGLGNLGLADPTHWTPLPSPPARITDATQTPGEP